MERGGLHINIITPDGPLFESDVLHVVFPGKAGPFAVYPLHAPIISSLDRGDIKCVTEEGERLIPVKRGFVEVHDNIITACVEQVKEDDKE